MDDLEIISNFRNRIGEPTTREYSDVSLQSTLAPTLMWLAGELGYNIVPSLTIPLTADDYTVALPADEEFLIWVEHNGKRLSPSSVNRWVRDGVMYRQDASATPRSYAVEGRKLLLNPPPDSGAVAADANLTLSYIAQAEELGPDGVSGLTDADLWVAIHRASVDWLGLHSGKTKEEIAQRASQKAANLEMFQALFPQAKRRREWPVRTQGAKRFRVGGRPWMPAK
jgi:hypothetical protein